MLFLLTVGALAVAGVGFLIAPCFGLPIGWSCAFAIYSASWARNGWKGLTNLGIGVAGIRKNSEAAFAILHMVALSAVVVFAASPLLFSLSAFWALLLPLLVIPAIAVQVALEFLLNIVNPLGKRDA
jgi:hypothetical protein